MATKKATSSVAVAKKAPATKKSSHPTYAVMVNEAIVALKERTGSSQYAIAKHIEDNQKDLPPNFKKLLLVQLKKLVAAGKLTKVKHSFKLSAVAKPTAGKLTKPATEKKAPAAKVVAKKAPAEKKSKSGAQAKATKVVAKARAKAKTPVKAKKAAPVKAVAKKPKSIKSPVKKVAAKKTAAKK